MASGILDTIGLAGAVLFAAPVALFGAQLLVGGSTVRGVAFLGIAAIMILIPRYVQTPKDIAGDAAKDVASTVVKTDDEEE